MYFCPYIIEIVDSRLFVKISDYTAYKNSPTLKTLILMTLRRSFLPFFFFWLSKCFQISPIQRTNCSKFKRQTSEKRIYCHFWWFFFTLDPSLSCLWLTLSPKSTPYFSYALNFCFSYSITELWEAVHHSLLPHTNSAYSLQSAFYTSLIVPMTVIFGLALVWNLIA